MHTGRTGQYRRGTGIRGLVGKAQERLQRLVGLAIEGLDGGGAFVGLLDSGTVALACCEGTSPGTLTEEHDLIAPVLRAGEAVCIEDTAGASEPRATALADAGIGWYAGFPLVDPHGDVGGVLVVFSDASGKLEPSRRALVELVAERVQEELGRGDEANLERRLLVSEERYRALSESNPDAVYTLDNDARLKSANPALASLAGYAHEELIGKRFGELVVPAQQDVVAQHLARATAGHNQAFRMQLLRRGGDYRDVAVTLTPHRLRDEAVELVGVARDISDTVAAEQRLDLALESSGQGIWEWDGNSDRVYRSHHLRRILGAPYEPAWVTTQYWLEALHPEDRPGFRALLEAPGDSEIEASQGQWRLDCGARGFRWFQWHARLFGSFSDGQPARVIGAVADIHDLKLAEDRRLREAGRMALAVRAGGAGSFELELNQGSLHYDARMHELLGLGERDAAVDPAGLVERFHPEDREAVQADLDALASQNNSLDQERRIIAGNGRIRHLRLLAQRMEAADGSPLVVGTCWDVTEAREMEAQLAYQARHDALTGLANRYEFERHLGEAQARVDLGGHLCAVGFIDLDRFKIVNDTAGHGAGDELLRQLGTYLARSLRATDTLARLGGDEFGLIVPDCSSGDARRRVEGIIEGLRGWQFQSQERVFEVSASGGVAALEPGGTVAAAMSHADVACYAAKMRGRGSVAVYEADDSEAGQHHRELKLAADIRSALSADRFQLQGQLIEPCHPAPGDSGGFIELLVRMVDENGELVPPDLFIPAAERYELMVAVDRWVVHNALLGEWHELAVREGIRLSINLSAQSINDDQFLGFVLDIIDRSRLPPDRINFEITETAVMTHLSNARVVVDELRQRGCTVALDDFGSGLSSFNYLRHFNVDFVKIDGGFVREMVSSEPDRIIVESINDLAHRLGAATIAEFVTDEAVLDSVRAIRVDYAQGYAIGGPEPVTSYYGIWPRPDVGEE